MRALLVFGLVLAGSATAHAEFMKSEDNHPSPGLLSGWDPDLSWTLFTFEYGACAHIYDGRSSLGAFGRFSFGLPRGLYVVASVEDGTLTSDAPMRDGAKLDRLTAWGAGLGLRHTWGWLTVGGDVTYGADRLSSSDLDVDIYHRHVEASAHATVWLLDHIEVGVNLGLGVARESDEMIGVHAGFGFGVTKRKGVLDDPLARLTAWSDANRAAAQATSSQR